MSTKRRFWALCSKKAICNPRCQLVGSLFAERGGFTPDRVASTMHVRGMGGFANAETTRVPTFEFGGIWTRDATADVSDADLGTEDVDGIVGTDLLRSYELWFDYRANAVDLRRAKR